MTVILSAAALVACADSGHEQCRAVQRVLMHEQGPFVLPGTIAEEVDALLVRRVPGARRGFFEDLVKRRFHVERLVRGDAPALERLEREYPELEINEMAIVIVAARLRCTRIVTLDEQPFRAIRPLYGEAFTLLPADV
ncbi:MAG TPA: hypothetical protein VG474_13210 [Solirubrobacteraceae bacterium]|nr:hypothetical protein [Solirubrobacteraceae bacterium]